MCGRAYLYCTKYREVWPAEKLINSFCELEEMPHAERNGSTDDDYDDDIVMTKVAMI